MWKDKIELELTDVASRRRVFPRKERVTCAVGRERSPDVASSSLRGRVQNEGLGGHVYRLVAFK
jgi:hypothetical protein